MDQIFSLSLRVSMAREEGPHFEATLPRAQMGNTFLYAWVNKIRIVEILIVLADKFIA